MSSLDLRAAGRATGIALADLVITDEERDRAIAEWSGRMVNEHVSARVFAQLAPQLQRAGAEPAVQKQVARMAAQELRHGRLCAGVVEALGGRAVAELPELEDVPLHEDAPPLEAVLRNVLAISCLNETVAVALLETGRQLAEPAPIHAVITEILRDEIGHARLGWKLVEELLPRTDAATRDRLTHYLAPCFEQLLDRHHLPETMTAPEAVPALGVEGGRESSRLFVDVLDEVILPGLERLGLGAREAFVEAAGPR